MKRLWLRRPSPGVVLGTLALIVAVAGNANAFSSTRVIVRKGEIANGAVTANTLAVGAVHPKALAKGSVGAPALRAGSVGTAALGRDAVGEAALAPGSVYGGALGAVTVHSAAIEDVDAAADLSTWTSSAAATAVCGAGERVVSGGVVFTDPGNRRVGIIQSVPFVNAGSSGWTGQITSDSGGSAKAEVQALCLK